MSSRAESSAGIRLSVRSKKQLVLGSQQFESRARTSTLRVAWESSGVRRRQLQGCSPTTKTQMQLGLTAQGSSWWQVENNGFWPKFQSQFF